MTAKSADLVIVGGGPAGCAAALSARAAGLSVILIESSVLPGRVPGETLHPGVEPLFRQLGIWDAVLREKAHRHRGIWVEWEGPRRFEPYGEDASGPWLGLQLDRCRLHHILLETTSRAGATVLRDTRARSLIFRTKGQITGIKTDQGVLRGGWILDASGRRRWLRRHLRLPIERLSPPFRLRFGWTHGQNPSLEGQPLLAARPLGWDWEAPLGKGGSAWVRFRLATPEAHDEHTAAARDGACYFWERVPQCALGNWLLLGEAASSIDPGSSHGVLGALRSGIMAVHLISHARLGRIGSLEVSECYRHWVGEEHQRDVSALAELYGRHPEAERFGSPWQRVSL